MKFFKIFFIVFLILSDSPDLTGQCLFLFFDLDHDEPSYNDFSVKKPTFFDFSSADFSTFRGLFSTFFGMGGFPPSSSTRWNC